MGRGWVEKGERKRVDEESIYFGLFFFSLFYFFLTLFFFATGIFSLTLGSPPKYFLKTSIYRLRLGGIVVIKLQLLAVATREAGADS